MSGLRYIQISDKKEDGYVYCVAKDIDWDIYSYKKSNINDLTDVYWQYGIYVRDVLQTDAKNQYPQNGAFHMEDTDINEDTYEEKFFLPIEEYPENDYQSPFQMR